MLERVSVRPQGTKFVSSPRLVLLNGMLFAGAREIELPINSVPLVIQVMKNEPRLASRSPVDGTIDVVRFELRGSWAKDGKLAISQYESQDGKVLRVFNE